VITLEALAEFATMMTGGPSTTGVDVTVTGRGSGVKSQFQKITKTTALLLQKFEVPKTDTSVDIGAHGEGFALVQCNVQYNVYTILNCNKITLSVETETRGNQLVVKLCGSWLGSGESGMVILEFTSLTGYAVTNSGTITSQSPDVSLVEQDGDNTNIYFNQLTNDPTCIEVVLERNIIVSNVKDGQVKIYRYYDTKTSCSMSYVPPNDNAGEDHCAVCPECCV